MLMHPEGAGDARDMFRKALPLLIASFSDQQIKAALKHVDQLVSENHVFEALKVIRGLYPIEADILCAEQRVREPVVQPLALVAGE